MSAVNSPDRSFSFSPARKRFSSASPKTPASLPWQTGCSQPTVDDSQWLQAFYAALDGQQESSSTDIAEAVNALLADLQVKWPQLQPHLDRLMIVTARLAALTGYTKSALKLCFDSAEEVQAWRKDPGIRLSCSLVTQETADPAMRLALDRCLEADELLIAVEVSGNCSPPFRLSRGPCNLLVGEKVQLRSSHGEVPVVVIRLGSMLRSVAVDCGDGNVVDVWSHNLRRPVIDRARSKPGLSTSSLLRNKITLAVPVDCAPRSGGWALEGRAARRHYVRYIHEVCRSSTGTALSDMAPEQYMSLKAFEHRGISFGTLTLSTEAGEAEFRTPSTQEFFFDVPHANAFTEWRCSRELSEGHICNGSSSRASALCSACGAPRFDPGEQVLVLGACEADAVVAEVFGFDRQELQFRLRGRQRFAKVEHLIEWRQGKQ